MSFKFEDAFEEPVPDKSEFEAARHLNETVKSAQKCLTSGDFHKYKFEFEQAYRYILNDMLLFTNRFLASESGSLEIYAVKMIRYMQRIQDLQVLLNKVTNDANKEISNVKG